MQEFLSISLLILLAAISPGPDFALVTKNSLMYSRKHGVFTAFGISTSLLIHTSYCVLGLAVVISKSLLAFTIIKYLGAAYLTYIGIKSLFAKSDKISVDVKQSTNLISYAQAFSQGFFGNILNPKAIMFLLAFFTLILKPNSSTWLEVGYGFEISVIHMLWFSVLSCALTHHIVQIHLNRMQYYIVKAMGAVLVAFGVRIATLSQAVMLPVAAIE